MVDRDLSVVGRDSSVQAAISVPSLLDEAASRAGSDDWGDLGFTAVLELFVDSCAESASLTPPGWRVLRSVILRHLRNRLALQERLRYDPALASTPVRAVVVTGLPRTGTTLVHNLLALDGDLRALRLWEALRPFPALGAPGSDKAARIEQAQSWLTNFYRLAPGMRTVHPVTAEGPEECDTLLQNSFASQHFDDMFDAERYSAWFARDPLRHEYRYYALQLGVLSEAPPARTWVLKSPGHLGHLDALMAAVPGAVVLHCHRHPLEAVASYASLIRTVRAPHTERMDSVVVGRQALERSSLAICRAAEVRDAAGPAPFFDLSYTRLVGEPMGVISEVYQWLGRPLRPGVQAAMQRWLAANPQHVHGPHSYGLGEFGLRAGEVTDTFAAYLDRFGALVSAPAGSAPAGSAPAGSAPPRGG